MKEIWNEIAPAGAARQIVRKISAKTAYYRYLPKIFH